MIEKGKRRKSVGPVVVAVLALGEGIFGVLRALHWVEIGSDLIQRGVLLLPIIGAVAFVRAALAAVIAILYGLFAWGLLAQRGWAWALGLAVSLVSMVFVGLALFAGESPGRGLLWAIVPVIVAGYLLAPAGRRWLGVGQT
jgi:hypothetical protein